MIKLHSLVEKKYEKLYGKYIERCNITTYDKV